MSGWAATIMADASHCSQTGAGGYAFWIASHRGKRGGQGTLNRVSTSTLAEMQAVCNALYTARECSLVLPGDEVLIQTDCVSAIHGFDGRRDLSKEESECRDAYLKLNNYVYVELRHVKGHSYRTEAKFRSNNACDERARREMRITRKRLSRGTHADV